MTPPYGVRKRDGRMADGHPYGVQGIIGSAEVESGWRAIGNRPCGCEGSIGEDYHALFLAVFLTGNTQILLTFPENYAIIQRL